MTRYSAWDASPLEDWDGPRRTIRYEEFMAEYRRLHNAWTYGDMPAEKVPLEIERLRGFVPWIDRAERHDSAGELLVEWLSEATGERKERSDRVAGAGPEHAQGRSRDGTTVSGGDQRSAGWPAVPGCPRCAGRGRPVLYGLPVPEAEQAASDGRIVLAGCLAPDAPEHWVCSSGHRWRDEDEDQWQAVLLAVLTEYGYSDDYDDHDD